MTTESHWTIKMLKDNITMLLAIIGATATGILGYADVTSRLAILEDHDKAELIKIQTVDAASLERDRELRRYIDNVGKSGSEDLREHDLRIGHDGMVAVVNGVRQEQVKTQSAVKYLGEKIDKLIDEVEKLDR